MTTVFLFFLLLFFCEVQEELGKLAHNNILLKVRIVPISQINGEYK